MNKLSLGAIGVAVVALVGGASYYFGKRQAAEPVPQLAAGPLKPGATAPANHPAMPGQMQQVAATQQGGPEQQGKVQVDPNAKFTHFRVGNRNVKSILLDGKIVWVGTSGGV